MTEIKLSLDFVNLGSITVSADQPIKIGLLRVKCGNEVKIGLAQRSIQTIV